MPINGATILVGATSAATGGSSKSFTLTGLKVNNGLQVADASETDARIRPHMVVKSIPGTYNKSTDSWTSDKRECVVARPKILSDGSVDFPSFRITYTGNPEVTAAEIATLRGHAAQAIYDADFDAFWSAGSLA
jgi:hypothetical protein